MVTSGLARAIEEQIERETGQQVIVEQTGAALLLSGRVDSPSARKAAEDIARRMAPDQPLTTSFEVEGVYPQPVPAVLPDELDGANQPYQGTANLPESVAEIERAGADIEPDFTDQRLETTGIEEFAAPLPLDPDPVDSLDEMENTVTPPMDPVITSTGGTTQVLGGFEASAMDDLGVARSASDGQYGDEAIAEAAREALRLDSTTTDLHIRVEVFEGVVRLRGGVPGLEDVDNAEAVAGRVPGVREVVEELEVGALED